MGIRLATPADHDALIPLNDECYPLEATDEVHSRLLRVARRNTCWVYEEEEAGIKACLLSEISESQPYIWSVATVRSHRGRGLATSLIQTFEKHYTNAGYHRPWLHVRADNPAQKLYFDAGYRVASFERNLYGVGQHGLVMRHTI